MEIVLFGASGRLGAAFRRALSLHSLHCPTTAEADLLNQSQLHAYLDRVQPDIIINATGYNAVDKAESPEGRTEAFALNAEAPESIAAWAAQHQRLSIMFSTDYVFSGTKDGVYTEEDQPDPINVYGESKADGERRSLARYPSGTVIIRTSRLYGPAADALDAKKSFLDLIHRDAENRPHFGVNREEYACPTSVDDLAEWVVEHFVQTPSPKPGIYHATGGGEPVTWFEWAKAYLEDTRLPSTIFPRDPSTMSRPARRPARLALMSTKLPALRPWREGQQAFLAQHPPTFQRRWYEELGLEGVRLEFQKYIGNPAGGVMHLLPGGVENPDGFGHSIRDIYAFNAQGRGQMRGGHYHHQLDELFFPMSGTALWVLSDFRATSPTRGKTVACILSVNEFTSPAKTLPCYSLIGHNFMTRVRVPAGIYHAIIPLTDERVTVTAVGSTPYAKEDYAYPALQEIPDLATHLEAAGIDSESIIPRNAST